MAQYRDNYKYTYITSAATTQVLTGQGALVRVVINGVLSGSIKIIDGTAGSTANIATIPAGTTAKAMEYSVQVVNGIRIVTSAADDITIVSSGLPS